MPVQKNRFDRFTDTSDADRICLERIGLAALQVSQPAAPKVTGNLQRSHKYAVEGDSVIVGVTADYGGYVHNGTSRQKAQPWLKDSIQANRDSILNEGVKAWESNIGL